MTIVITGAASGIGLSLVKYYLSKACNVLAIARKASEELQATEATIIEGVDVASPITLSKLKAELSFCDAKVDLLINCAGVLFRETLDDLNYDHIEQQWQVNALGPLRVTETVLPFMHEGAKVAMITSRMGSIEDNTSGSRYGYRMSKAALNAASKSLAVDLKPKGISVAILHPGLVSTKMTGFQGDVTSDEASARLAQRIDELNLENSGTFWHAGGDVLPW